MFSLPSLLVLYWIWEMHHNSISVLINLSFVTKEFFLQRLRGAPDLENSLVWFTPSSGLALLGVESELSLVESMDRFQVRSLSRAWFGLLLLRLMCLTLHSSTVEGEAQLPPPSAAHDGSRQTLHCFEVPAERLSGWWPTPSASAFLDLSQLE